MIYDIVIVGAGMSGIAAGNQLSENGYNVKILDKGKILGGRLATRRISINGKKNVFDYGCKYLEATSYEFGNKIIELIKSDDIKKWNVNNQNAVLGELDKTLKFINKKSIREIAILLAKNLDIETKTKVKVIRNGDEHWNIYTDRKKEYKAKNLILSMPIPQSLDLIEKSNLDLNNQKLRKLSEVKYNKSIVGLFTLKGKSNLVKEGGLKIENENIEFITDNNLKGINSNHTAIVVEMTDKFSRSNWNKSDAELLSKIKGLSEEWIGTEIINEQIHKWKYSTPASIYNKRFEYFNNLLPLYIIGDAFMGNNVESAYLSGFFSAKHLIEKNVSILETLDI